MRLSPVIATATIVAVLAAMPAAAQSPAHKQISKSLRLTDQQAEQLSFHQLIILKAITESSTLSEGDKRRRTRAILSGVVPRFRLSF